MDPIPVSPVLPNEILAGIFTQLPSATLVQVSAVSSRFKAVAERILYSSIHIQDTVSPQSPNPWKTLRWCDSVVKRLDFADVTRRVHIRWQTGQADVTAPAPQYFITFCEYLGEVLRLLDQVESLELFLGPANLLDQHQREPIHAIERVVGRCHLPYLRSCSLGADYTKGAQPYTPVLAGFLQRHPELQHLKIPDLNFRLNIPRTAVCNLTSFRGSADAAASLLPGRPVEHLALFGDDSSVSRENLPQIACTSIPLRHLDLSAMSVRPMLLKNIAVYLPHLHSFRVRLALRHTLHYAFTGIVSTASIRPLLKLLIRCHLVL